MGLLTIGDFARRAGLTPKALRLYDRLGLVPPAAVDPDSGYRLYEPGQLPRARLVARLREIDMPLAEIRTVCALAPGAAAEAVAAYWRRVTTVTAERARLAALLVSELSEGDDMTTESIFRFAARCEIGAVRDTNQDAVYAGDRLLAVADGGGGPAGAAAAAAAIGALRGLDPAGPDLLTALAGALAGADRAVGALATRPVSTLTALLRHGSRLALAHVGDSRAYLLRRGELTQLTQDHSWVQTQVDAGELGPAEAAAHPQRALLVRALGAGGAEVEADLALRTALPGDRYLLCTDGLSAVVGRAALHAALAAEGDPEQVAQRLVDLAQEAGAPDNIACVVADFTTG